MDTSDEALDIDDSDEPEFSLLTDWGVSSFDRKPTIWNFEGLTKLKRQRTKQKKRIKKNPPKINISKDNSSTVSSTMALEEILPHPKYSPNSNQTQFKTPTLAQTIVMNLANSNYLFLDVSNSLSLQ